MADILAHIFTRRSIRKFTTQSVPEEVIDRLLQAGMAAPSATNAKPWEFIVITNPSRLAQVQNLLPFGKHNAPLTIIVCGNPAIAKNRIVAEKFWVQDCSAATENILLAAAGLGLGACWVGIYPIYNLVKRISSALDLPAGVTPLCAINIGYPMEQKTPRTQYDPARIHYQTYGSGLRAARSPDSRQRIAALWGVVLDYLRWLLKTN
ncbi:MAG: nitroreductase family protein [Anaerolineae bacterium]|nr:nitroreductase family protein [Anaerolineae bacterium]